MEEYREITALNHSILKKILDSPQEFLKAKRKQEEREPTTEEHFIFGSIVDIASHELSERLQRIVCVYCQTANPLGEGSCSACGAPLGNAHPTTCPNCGFAVTNDETTCPNCKQKL